MKKKFKRIAVLFLLLMAGLPVIFILSFSLQQQIIRHKMRARIEKQYVQEIILDSHQFQWTRDKDEIVINGELFDIKSSSFREGHFVFTGLFDRDESTLLEILKNDWKHTATDSKSLVQLIQFFQSLFYTNGNVEELNTSPVTHHRMLPAEKLPQQFQLIPTPPPLA